MKTIELNEVLPLDAYEKVRDNFRKQVIEQKKRRRLQVGPYISLSFENRETVLFQIQEMVRTEHLHEEAKIKDEVDTFNDLIPGPGELSATLFIEITEEGKIRETLDRLIGIDKDNVVYFQLGKTKKVPGVFEKGRSTDEKVSSVHYLRFKWSPVLIETFRAENENYLVIDHPRYKEKTLVPEETKKTLLEDLESAE